MNRTLLSSLSRFVGGERKRPSETSRRRTRVHMETLERRFLLAAIDDNPGAGPPEGEPVPDFELIDTNNTSTTYNQLVSPRDYLDQVSAWYFGHAT